MSDSEYKCNCGNEALPPHPCPFAEEIHDDSETMCTCCEECTYECKMAI